MDGVILISSSLHTAPSNLNLQSRVALKTFYDKKVPVLIQIGTLKSLGFSAQEHRAKTPHALSGYDVIHICIALHQQCHVDTF